MKKNFLIIMCMAVLSANAQINLLKKAGNSIAGQADKNKKEKWADKYLSTEIVRDDTLYVMRVPNDKIKSKGDHYIIKLQDKLAKAKTEFINQEPIDKISSIAISIDDVKMADKAWVTTYYEKEYNVYATYETRRSEKAQQDAIREKKRQDSLSILRIAEEKRQKAITDSIKKEEARKMKETDDSLKLVKYPYQLLRLNLQNFTTHPDFTVFCGIDVYFAENRLSGYLQSIMQMASKDFKVTPTLITETFIPKFSSTGKESLTAKFHLKKNDKRPYAGAPDDPCYIITKCEITGTADLIVKLFINYWTQEIKVGGYKEGEIAHFQFWGDRVALHGISRNTYKILITKEGDFDYYTTFKIK